VWSMSWYRDHTDGTGWHADRPADRLDRAVIPVLSLDFSPHQPQIA